MYRYLCVFCNTIVTYGERHPCFFYKEGGYEYSLPETPENGNRRLDEETKIRAENSKDNFENPWGVAQQDNTEESQKLSRRFVESDVRSEYCSHSTISGSSANIPSFSANSKENQTSILWNSSEGFELACRPQVDARAASRRESIPKKIVYERNKGIICDPTSFRKHSGATCSILRDKNCSNVFKNAISRSSSNTKNHGKEAHLNSANICETSNLIPCVAFPQGNERSHKVLTRYLLNPIGVPISPEVTLLDRYSSGLSITNAEKLHNSIKNANSTTGSSSTHRHPEKKRFPCKKCDKSFDGKIDCVRHYRTPTGKKPFVCYVCQKGFAQKGNLTFHYRIHTGEKPFLCNVCNKEFTQKSNLNTHYRTHTGDKPFVCGVCKKKFTRTDTLERHFRTHTA